MKTPQERQREDERAANNRLERSLRHARDKAQKQVEKSGRRLQAAERDYNQAESALRPHRSTPPRRAN